MRGLRAPLQLGAWTPWVVLLAALGSARRRLCHVTHLMCIAVTVTRGQIIGFYYPTNPAVYTQSSANIAPNTPVIDRDSPPLTNSSLIVFYVNPPLPGALQLNPSTGNISGAPTVAANATVYTITGQCGEVFFYVPDVEGTGAVTCIQYQLTLSVLPIAPLFSMSSTVYLGTIGVALSTAQPTNLSAAEGVQWSVAPPLPSGLALNTTTGVISGTPSQISALTYYLLTAFNAGGSSSIYVQISSAYAVDPIAQLNSNIDTAQNDAKLAVTISVIAISLLFVCGVLMLLVFLAWRARKENIAPAVIVTEEAVEKLAKLLNPVPLRLESMGQMIEKGGILGAAAARSTPLEPTRGAMSVKKLCEDLHLDPNAVKDLVRENLDTEELMYIEEDELCALVRDRHAQQKLLFIINENRERRKQEAAR